MPKAKTFDEQFSHRARLQPTSRWELVDSFKNLEKLIDGFSSCLSRQELETLLKESCNCEPSSKGNLKEEKRKQKQEKQQSQ